MNVQMTAGVDHRMDRGHAPLLFELRGGTCFALLSLFLTANKLFFLQLIMKIENATISYQ